jgi:hypothetical protein
MEITTKLKKRFCKDFNIPIDLFQEPYFSERLKLFDKQFNTLELWDLYINETSVFKTDEEYFAYYNKFKDTVINHIQNKLEYKDFIICNMDIFKIPKYEIGGKSVFNENNIGKTLVSIDLTEANFNALRYFNELLVDNTNTYKEFISQFTNLEHFKKSKYIRQVIYGNCNPKRQTTIEHFMMNFIMEELLKYINISAIKSFMCDEIVFEWNEKIEEVNIILQKLYKIAIKYDFKIHHEIYELRKISNSDIYVKYLNDNSVDFKCVNPLFYPILIRQYQHDKIQGNDLIFYHEGYLSKFIEIPKIEVV